MPLQPRRSTSSKALKLNLVHSCDPIPKYVLVCYACWPAPLGVCNYLNENVHKRDEAILETFTLKIK